MRTEVYPRVCGGTLPCNSADIQTSGLSPRVRGNPLPPAFCHYTYRSIPACAGEPPFRTKTTASIRVYPRVCGGTSTTRCPASASCGLSPRVRGNHGHCHWYLPQVRSIPACAGEPGASAALPSPTGVYPRVCGGTRGLHCGVGTRPGLSPRVRGNPADEARTPSTSRSIPACAGEPSAFAGSNRMLRVYPRVCGGTRWAAWFPAYTGGLSPRVRGNRRFEQAENVERRSIPACAGEPPQQPRHCVCRRVYPRVCGGTSMSGCPAP